MVPCLDCCAFGMFSTYWMVSVRLGNVRNYNFRKAILSEHELIIRTHTQSAYMREGAILLRDTHMSEASKCTITYIYHLEAFTLCRRVRMII